MKLELKHLVGYLPYNLEYIDYGYEDRPVMRLGTLRINANGIGEFDDDDNVCMSFEDIKPLLRPLSVYKDLVSPAMSDLGTDFDIEVQINELANKEISLSMVCKAAIDTMNEHHIDYYGLIDQGLAIDKTLER